MFLIKRILAVCLAAFAVSCAGKSVFTGCDVSGAEFSKSGFNGIVLRFSDNGACDYRLVKETGTDWAIELPSGQFGDFRPAADSFSSGVILSSEAEAGRYRLVFREGMDLRPVKEGSRTVFIIRPAVSAEPGAAAEITSAVCSKGGVPFLLKVNADGVMAYELGVISSGKGYLDIFAVSLADNFTLSPGCGGIVASVSRADFPERVRFIITDPLVASMKAGAEGASVAVSQEKTAGPLHILRIHESRDGIVQTVKIYTSSSVEPRVEGLTGGGISVALGKGVRPVSGLPKVSMLSGPAFSSMSIDESGDETFLIFKSPVPAVDVDVYAEKTGYGFVIYAKKLR